MKPFCGQQVYNALFERWGAQAWWPARTRMEIIIGAILTQNTAWTNVEKAMGRLRKERALQAKRLTAVSEATLATWIRPAGYYHVKAKRINAFTDMLNEQFGGSLHMLFALETPLLRERLLQVKGIGPETADCILLYGGGRLSFVVDAYTRRFLLRHGWIDASWSYGQVADLMTGSLIAEPQVYNEFHALIVRLGKECCCSRNPNCDECPLRKWL